MKNPLKFSLVFLAFLVISFQSQSKQIILEIEVTDKVSGSLLDAEVSLRAYKGDLVVSGERISAGIYQVAVDLAEDADFLLAVEKKGYMFANLRTTIKANVQVQKQRILLSPFEINVNYELKNIYFESKSAILTFEAQKELQKLEKLLKTNQGLQIEVSGHSDNNGLQQELLDISSKRAMAAAVYLESRGVEIGRMKPVGYGPQRPVVSNDDEFEGRELNRRVEFKIIGGL